MKSNYKRIGDYIELVDKRNEDLSIDTLLGLSISKKFIPSVANTIGTNMKRYKVIRKNQFACSIMQVRRDKKMPVAILKDYDEAIISQAYPVFQVSNENILSPDYLMMWFSREEFDRQATFWAVGGVRGSLEWEDFLNFELPIPPIEDQRAIVAEYQTVTDRIHLNEQINAKLEETAQTLYRHWFVGYNNFIKLSEVIDINPKHNIQKGQIIPYVEMADLQEEKYSIKGFRMREYNSGSKFKNYDTLLARITPCLENGKTALVDVLPENQIAYGSTEFIVMRAKPSVSPFFVYFLARDENFRSYAISSMVGSSGRQRVESEYLKKFNIQKLESSKMNKYHNQVEPLFTKMRNNRFQIEKLQFLKTLLLSKMAGKEQKVMNKEISSS